MSRKEKDNPVQQAFADLLLVTGAGDKMTEVDGTCV